MRGMAREYAAGNSRGPGWHEFAGKLGQLQAGSQAGSGMARSRAMARVNRVSQGQCWGRCRVRRRAERVIRPTRAKTRRLSPNPPMRSGLGVGTRGEGRGTRRPALDPINGAGGGLWLSLGAPMAVLGSGAGAGSAGQHAGEDNRGPGRCDSVGRLGSLVDGSGAVGAVRQAMAGLAIEPGRE